MPLLFESRRMSTMPKSIDEELKARSVRLVIDHHLAGLRLWCQAYESVGWSCSAGGSIAAGRPRVRKSSEPWGL